MATLFDEENSEDEGQLKINKSYADRYTQWREKEEYQKLKDKYGEGAAMQLAANGSDDESSSSTSESEDDGEAWGSDVEKKFFQTLASLKTKDPSIYDTETKFFDKTMVQEVVPKKKTKKEEKMTLRDYERKLVLEKGGKLSDDEEVHQPTFREEQEQLKKGFEKLLDDSDSEADDLLTIRPKNSTQKEEEEEEYTEWLKGQKEDISNEEIKSKLKPLKEYWCDPKLDENEKFLKDFFLNKRYKDEEDKNRIPTYDEVVHDSEGDLSEDEKTLEKQLEFEHKYNFRFEEPDPEFIKRFPRTIADSMRRPDTSRKMHRDEVKARKKREKEEKKEELKQLKKYKLKEIQEKLEQLKAITGNPSLPFQDEDLEEDFNPEKHDKKMNEIFNQDYYHNDEGDTKPEFPFDPEIDDENWDNYTGEEAGPSYRNDDYEPHCEDPDFNMDCEYEDNPRKKHEEEMTEMTRTRNKGRKKSIFAKKLETKKPVFDPQQYPNYEEYLEEYYKLDYEDIIGDQPVRFKYRTVLANDYGLETEEILAARDKELNNWCSVKKMSQYRTETEELQEFYTFKTKRKNALLKKKMLPSLFAENTEELLEEDKELKRKKRRKNQGKPEEPEHVEDVEEQEEAPVLKKKKRKNKGKDDAIVPLEIEEPTENCDGAPQKKRKMDINECDEVLKASKFPEASKEIKSTSNEVVTNSAYKDVMSVKETLKNSQASDANCVKELIPLKKKNLAQKVSQTTNVSSPATVQCSTDQPKKKKKKKKKKNQQQQQQLSSVKPVKTSTKKKANKLAPVGMDISDERLKAYGLNPKKFKNTLKYGKTARP
nr:EOG090X05XL [Eurycercus lamellatus]